MSDALNLTLARAKQAHEDRLRPTPLDALDRNDFGSGPKRERVAKLLDKSLKQLGEDIVTQVQGLSAAVDTVRGTGNRTLHPKKHDVVAHPKVMRAEELECVRAVRLFVETLYSDKKLREPSGSSEPQGHDTHGLHFVLGRRVLSPRSAQLKRYAAR